MTRRVLRWSLGLFAATWIVFTFNAPACVYLPSVPGKPAVTRKIMGADAAGRVYWVEAERSVAFAWGLRWWFEFNPHVPPGQGGFEYVPPLRFATGPWAGWRIVRSDGQVRPYPPLQGALLDPGFHFPGVPAWQYLDVPYVTGDGTLIVHDKSGVHSLAPNTTGWTSVAGRLPEVAPYAYVPASARLEDGTLILFHQSRPSQPRFLDHREDRLFLTAIDPTLGREIRRREIVLPGPRSKDGGRYVLSLAAIDHGLLLFEAHGSHEIGPGTGDVFSVSVDFSEIRRVASFSCDAVERASFSVPADGTLFTTGEAVYRITGDRIAEVGPFSSSVWVGHRLVGVRSYPYMAKRVLERRRSFRELFDRVSGSVEVRPPSTWLGDSEMWLFSEVGEARGAAEKGHWFLGGIDEAGKADEIASVVFP